PAWRAGALAEPKRVLLEDHLRECVPCRRARRELERSEPARPAAAAAPLSRRLPLALAAGIGVAAIAGLGIWLALGGAIAPPRAELRSLEGEIFALDAGTARPLAAGEILEEGRTVRTAAGSRAVFELADGTRVEMAPRSELELDRRHDGVVLDLGRGSVIVEAAKQDRGRLYLRTDDCLVSVVGTIFTVNHGVRGSRVSVLEGEVRVRHGDELAILRPGDQVATSARLDRVPLEREIAWSRNAAEYRERLAALAELGRELDRLFAAPAPRTSTRLLDAAPADTLVYVAIPNLTGTLAEAWETVEQRVDENPALASWWNERLGGDGDRGTEVRAALEDLRRFGSWLGDEVVVALGRGGSGEPGEPVVLAEIADRHGFEAFLDEEIARISAESSDGAEIRRVEAPVAADGFDGLTVWLTADDLFVATPSPERLAAVAAGGFDASPFHARLLETYAGGAEWLLGVDAGAIFEHVAESEREATAFETIGLADVEHFVVESRSEDGETIHRARLSFRGERRGIASWLAEPAGSGAIDFVSPEASVAVAGLVKRPEAILDDLLELVALGG
ncbi:MAG TPA: FecR domain-containing protein, partial [Thermoanaerobaculia bacterium]|nr:FecR domain-containing protein [Thermoanaerobaculia bacterium]